MKFAFSYDSPVGRIYIAESDGALTDLLFRPVEGAAEKKTRLISLAAEMLGDYFNGRLKSFESLPLGHTGTDFQMKAWNALLTIPYGQTRTYKEQAEIVGNIKACRAVGAANGKNPISIIIPCHRVIGSDKTLTGYGGGLPIKKALLDLERKYI